MLEEIKTSRFVVGTKQTIKAVEHEEAALVYLAQDASDYMKNKIIQCCKAKNVPIQLVETMEQLGNSCGICRGAATAAIIK